MFKIHIGDSFLDGLHAKLNLWDKVSITYSNPLRGCTSKAQLFIFIYKTVG